MTEVGGEAKRESHETRKGEVGSAGGGIEAIYNPLPNYLQVPWSMKAAEAGKHVLCEKPPSLRAAEARTLLAAGERYGVKICEAFMVKTHAQWLRTRELIRKAAVGELREIVGAFSYFKRGPENVRNRARFNGWGRGGRRVL